MARKKAQKAAIEEKLETGSTQTQAVDVEGVKKPVTEPRSLSG